MTKMFRQGDVLLITVAGIPAAAAIAKIDGDRIILAYGEATGHHHSVAVKDAEKLTDAEAVFLRIMTETPLEHQEHSAITVPPGNYRVVIQRVYTPEEIRNVAD